MSSELTRNSEAAQEVQVTSTLAYFDKVQYSNKPIAARDELAERMAELCRGRNVPVVMFNCIDFEWTQNPDGGYPLATPLPPAVDPITFFYRDDIATTQQQLKQIGSPEMTIIIPDNELMDSRVFPYTQNARERLRTGFVSKDALQGYFESYGVSVALWSEFCAQNGLEHPFEYTARNYKKIMEDPTLIKKIKHQAKDSRRYFLRNGMDPEYVAQIPDNEVLDRVAWYCAMYAGEGQALDDAQAVALNLEDLRVAAWFGRGADDQLPIVTPVDPLLYSRWKNAQKYQQSDENNV